MKETTIAFVTFFMLFFLVFLIRVGRQLKRRKKTNRKMPNLILFSKIRKSKTADFDCDCGGADCGGDCGGGDCDCGGGDCDCGDCDCPGGGSGCDSGCCECLACLAYTGGGGTCDSSERRTSRREAQSSYQKRIEEQKRKGYKKIGAEEESNVKALVDEKGKSSIWWLSFTAKMSMETVIEIFTRDPDYIIKNDYVYNKEALSLEEELGLSESKIKEGICAFCNNPYETEIDFCPNCGASIELPKESIVSFPEEQKDEQVYYRTDRQEVAEKPKSISENVPILALLFGLATIITYFIPLDLVVLQIVFSAIAIILGISGIILKKMKGLAITGLVSGIISLVLWLLLIIDIFYIWNYF